MLYTLRDECARDFEGTLRAVAGDRLRGRRAVRPARARRRTRCGPCSTSWGSPCAAGTRRSRRSRATSTAWPASSGRSEATGSCWRGSHRRRPPTRQTRAVARIAAARDRARDGGSPLRLPQPRRRAAPATTTVAPSSTGCSSSTRSSCSSRSISGGPGSPGWSRRAWSQRLARACAAGARQGSRPRAEQRASSPSATATSATAAPARARRPRHRVAARRAGRGRGAGAGGGTPLVRGGHRHGRERRHEIAGAGRHRRLRRYQPRLRRRTPPPSTRSRSSPAPISMRRGRAALGGGVRARTGVGRGAARVPLDRRRPQPHASARARGRDAKRARSGQARLLGEAARGHRGATQSSSGSSPRNTGSGSAALPTSSWAALTRRRGRFSTRVRSASRSPCRRRCCRRRPGALAPRPGHLLRERGGAAARHGAVLPDRDRGRCSGRCGA